METYMSDRKAVYPIVLTPISNGGYCVAVPDMGNHTGGSDLADAILAAQDAIETTGVFLEDEGKPIPGPSGIETITTKGNEIKTLVSVDFSAYRRKIEKRVVKKTLSLPSWLNVEAEDAGLNFSAVLQEALKAKLGVEI
jgi:predicted RNase H-like HicB family nuclease